MRNPSCGIEAKEGIDGGIETKGNEEQDGLNPSFQAEEDLDFDFQNEIEYKEEEARKDLHHII